MPSVICLDTEKCLVYDNFVKAERGYNAIDVIRIIKKRLPEDNDALPDRLKEVTVYHCIAMDFLKKRPFAESSLDDEVREKIEAPIKAINCPNIILLNK